MDGHCSFQVLCMLENFHNQIKEQEESCLVTWPQRKQSHGPRPWPIVQVLPTATQTPVAQGPSPLSYREGAGPQTLWLTQARLSGSY